MFIEWAHEDENGDETIDRIPAKWAVCQDCEGDGRVLNRSIGRHAYSAEEWNDQDDEFKEEYCKGGRGAYGVQCDACKGRTTVLEPDEDACTSEPLKTLLEAYYQNLDETARDRESDRRTRYFEDGCPGSYDEY